MLASFGGPGGAEGVWDHSRGLADAVADAAPALGLRVASPTADEEQSAITALAMPEGVDAAKVAARLLHDHRLLVSSRAGLLRVSPHLDNSADDVQRLVEALREISCSVECSRT